MAYTTLAEVRQYADFDPDDTSDDGRLSALIPQAQAVIDEWTKTTFEATDSVKYFDAVEDVEGLTLYLQGGHVFDVLASITTITNGDGVEVTSDQYVTEPRNSAPYHAIKLKSSANVSWTYTDDSENAIAINGAWGHSSSVPEPVKLACQMLVISWYRMEEVEGMMSDSICAILMPFRRLS